MVEDASKDIEGVRKTWDAHANRYDKWYETFEGAVEHYVDWKLLEEYLPENKNAKILDAAGGTGRITLLLARMGYSITLCDISPRMMDVAKQKLRKERLLDRVQILECDVRDIPFPDESFDFVLCWDGMIEAARELIRVTKRGGKISVFLVNRCRGAIDLFQEDPTSALDLIKSRSGHVRHHEMKRRAVSAEEAQSLFEAGGIRVLDIYAVCGWLPLLPISKKVLKSRSWDEGFFNQVTEMVLGLSKEPSVGGMSRHLVLYGERI